MTMGHTNPATKGFRMGARLFIENFLPEMEGKEGAGISKLTIVNSHRNGTISINEVIEEINNKKGTEKPEGGRAADTVHDSVAHTLDILYAALNGILVLVVRFRLSVLNAVKA